MSKQKWELKTYEEKPNWGVGDYDEYYEIVNERGDALQATDHFDEFKVLADLLNAYPGEFRITTALEINLHCDNQMLKMENEHLKAEVKTLKEVRDSLWKCFEDEKKNHIHFANECERLELENSKMRKALEAIARMELLDQFSYLRMQRIATSALKLT